MTFSSSRPRLLYNPKYPPVRSGARAELLLEAKAVALALLIAAAAAVSLRAFALLVYDLLTGISLSHSLPTDVVA